MLEYQPIPNTSDLTPKQRGAVRRQLQTVYFQLDSIKGDRTDESMRLFVGPLHAFMDVALINADYGAMRLALDLWQREPAEYRAAVKQRAEQLKTPAERARQRTTEELRRLVAHPPSFEPCEEEKPRQRKVREIVERTEQALHQAYRNELRHREHPYLSLVSVNDNPMPPLRESIADVLMHAEVNTLSDLIHHAAARIRANLSTEQGAPEGAQ